MASSILFKLLLWSQVCIVTTTSVMALEDNNTSPSTNFEALERFWSYGRSPPVYPTPQGHGFDDWHVPYQRAMKMVRQMTAEEKANVSFGYDPDNGCSGLSGSVPRLGFPGLCLNDAGSGLRGSDGVNAYPAGISAGASWNKDLTFQRAKFMGAEFKAKGSDVILGPIVGPLGKIAVGGRNWEGFSNDPYLAGALAYDSIQGLQKSVIACVKHLIGNEQETNRVPYGDHNASISSNIEDRTLHELYLWPFQDAVKAGVGSVMCSYQRVNNSYSCQNSKLQNGLLKGELGFDGFIVSDWGAQYTGIASANAGLDLAMPDSQGFWGSELIKAVNNHTLEQSRLDDMVTRIVATWYKYAPSGPPGFGIPLNLTKPHEVVSGINREARKTLFQGAVEAQVLVKNVDNALPLKAPRVLSLFGYDAVVPLVNNPTTSGSGRFYLGYDSLNKIPKTNGPYSTTDVPQIAMNGTLITGGGSGAGTPAYISTPYDAFQQRAYEDGTWLAWDFVSQNPDVDGGSDACIVFINEFASEGFDRPGLADAWSDTLVQNVADKCAKTIVVIHNAGIRLVENWINHPNVKAVIYAHLPGQDSGRALVETIYGVQSPSGRLPYTVAKQAKDYGTVLLPTVAGRDSDYYTQDNFTEGVYIDYRAFNKNKIEPRFPFGFGLTYSTFEYSELKVDWKRTHNASRLPPSSAIKQGGTSSLWDEIVGVTCIIRNTGKVKAAEVAQLYLAIPNAPAKQLRGFHKVNLEAGESRQVTFSLTRRDLSNWDVVAQDWALQSGEYGIYVSKDVNDVQLSSVHQMALS